MNTVDPRWKNGIDFEDVNSLLHIMIRNKDTDVFLILTLPFYGTSSIRKRIRTPIYSGYLPETFSTRCRFMEHLASENGSEHRFIPDTYQRRFPHVSQTSFTFNTSCRLQPIMNHTNYNIHDNIVKFCFTSGAGVCSHIPHNSEEFFIPNTMYEPLST